MKKLINDALDAEDSNSLDELEAHAESLRDKIDSCPKCDTPLAGRLSDNLDHIIFCKGKAVNE